MLPDDSALLPILVREEAAELGIENIPAHVRHTHNITHTEELALDKKENTGNMPFDKMIGKKLILNIGGGGGGGCGRSVFKTKTRGSVVKLRCTFLCNRNEINDYKVTMKSSSKDYEKRIYVYRKKVKYVLSHIFNTNTLFAGTLIKKIPL